MKIHLAVVMDRRMDWRSGSNRRWAHNERAYRVVESWQGAVFSLKVVGGKRVQDVFERFE